MESSYDSRIRSIMQALHSLAAIDRERAIKLEDLARIVGMGVDDVKNVINKLKTLGYVNVTNDSVHLTSTAIIKLSSIYC
ncbi:MAG: hypothetical protein TU36_000430 [Vulcanisaeta sp. AZ3]|nr:MAG: hypothetical protein TU36_03395 [Vulcanisaeta sp. AZ3]